MSEAQVLKSKKQEAVWTAHTLFDRGKTNGTSANISFLDEGVIYISRSGSCFGLLTEADLLAVPLEAETALFTGVHKPSKELTLHRLLYQAHPEVQAVIHTHAPYATLWSCLPHENIRNVIPAYTPYLKMKLGNVVAVPYAKPGSKELFTAFKNCLGPETGYLLSHHGPIVGGKDMLHAFECLEELEQSAFIAWNLFSSKTDCQEID